MIHKWHAISVDEIKNRFGTDLTRGLSSESYKKQFEAYGANELKLGDESNSIKRFISQFKNPLIYILIASGIITAFLGEYIDSSVIFGVIFLNAIIGYFQESKAVKALNALKKIVLTKATVLRNGEKHFVDSVDLVPGDVVLISAGDKIPADIRIVEDKNLEIDESILTGESIPVRKSTKEIHENAILAERTSMAYASTLVTKGLGIGIVVSTGNNTQTGKIANLVSQSENLETPLTKKITKFSTILLYIILGFAFLTFFAGLIRGKSVVDMIMAAVALAVGAIPEGLPAAVTITLAIGVGRMAKRHAIIRKLPAVETLGSTTVICTDKTGTLTKNEMTVKAINAGFRNYEVSGNGYELDGKVLYENKPIIIDDNSVLNELMFAGILCNDSHIKKATNKFEIQGDPTESALKISAEKYSLNSENIYQTNKRLDALPFESDNQYMLTLNLLEDGTKKIFAKGSAEKVLELCSQMVGEDGKPVRLDLPYIKEAVDNMARRGLRVIAFASMKTNSDTIQKVDNQFIFLGLQGMIDPPRAEVKTAVNACQNAGIKIKIVTGDHALTAYYVAKKLGINGADSEDNFISGHDLDKISDKDLKTKLKNVVVFARVSPVQKLRLVKVLREMNNVIAMTGDGVNDAPALKNADIGISMGQSGTEVAKEAADMILTDDNFASIEAAVEEGRGVFDNLVKFIAWTMPTQIAEGLVIMLAIFLGMTLPILPVQVLWINMTSTVFLGMALAFEKKESGIMSKTPRKPDEHIFNRNVQITTVIMSIVLVMLSFSFFKWALMNGQSIAQARTIAVNVFIIVELFYLMNCRSFKKSLIKIGVFSNLWVVGGIVCMLIFQYLYTYSHFMNKIFKSAPIDKMIWVYITIAGFLVFIIIELIKVIRAKHFTS